MEENVRIDSFNGGNVNIADDVIGIISSIAASEIKGVQALSGSFSDELVEKFGKKKINKGIQVEVNNGIVVVQLNVVVDYGTRIQIVAENIQESVKTAIESMTGLKVASVIVNVLGVSFQDSVKSKSEGK